MSRKPSTPQFQIGTHVVTPQWGREVAAQIKGRSGEVYHVMIMEGPNAGRVLDTPARLIRVPAAFEVVA